MCQKKTLHVGLNFQLPAEYSVVDRCVFLLEINVNQDRKAELIKLRSFKVKNRTITGCKQIKVFPWDKNSVERTVFAKLKPSPGMHQSIYYGRKKVSLMSI